MILKFSIIMHFREGMLVGIRAQVQRVPASDQQKPRAWIVLLTAQGKRAAALMKGLKASNPPLNLWRRRCLGRV